MTRKLQPGARKFTTRKFTGALDEKSRVASTRTLYTLSDSHYEVSDLQDKLAEVGVGSDASSHPLVLAALRRMRKAQDAAMAALAALDVEVERAGDVARAVLEATNVDGRLDDDSVRYAANELVRK